MTCLYLDWNETVKDAKLINILNLIIAYEDSGPDVIVFQEIENNNVLQQLFNLLEPYGYSDYKLLEGNDYRGIDNAIIFNIQLKILGFITLSLAANLAIKIQDLF